MKQKLFALAALSMALGVACGAFGAHALRGSIPDTDLDIWEKAVFYHLIHGLAVLVILAAPPTLVAERIASRVAQIFLFGTFVFCGSLYALVLTNTRWLGAITPIGGVCFILGWTVLGWAVLKHKD
jgi:uncharacterized membrane protein YgdD (TMEM256/DUF423 family)